VNFSYKVAYEETLGHLQQIVVINYLDLLVASCDFEPWLNFLLGYGEWPHGL
jgi:hypothetical protein